MLRHHNDDDRLEFAPLTLVYADAIGVDQFVEVFVVIMDFLSVKIDHAFTVVDNIDDISYRPIENAPGHSCFGICMTRSPIGIGKFPRAPAFP